MKKALKSLVLSLLLASLAGCGEEPIPSYSEQTLEKMETTFVYKDLSDQSLNGLSYAPSLGKLNLLVMPVWFSDSEDFISKEKAETVRGDIEKAFFGNEEETGWESVSTYYKKDSCGKLEISGVISPWFECGYPSSQYEKDDGDETISLVIEAADWYKETFPETDMTQFDADKDGYLDGVMLVYAAPDYKAKRLSVEEGSNLWAYTFWTLSKPQKSLQNPGANAFLWASYDFLYDPAVSEERSGKTRYAGGHNANGLTIDAHVYIHETGHLLGLDDYYDYGNTWNIPAGKFSMQDGNLGGHDPFSKLALGWGNVYVPTESCVFSVRPCEGTNEMVVLSNDFTGSPFDEYIIIELFSPTGLNERDCTYRYGTSLTGPNEAGARIWHIDGRLIRWDEKGEPELTSQIEPGRGYTYLRGTNNTTAGERSAGYTGKFEHYLNHLIRKNKDRGYFCSDAINNGDLFKTGDKFSVPAYSGQFFNHDKMNDGNTFPWTVRFYSVTDEKMVVSCVRG